MYEEQKQCTFILDSVQTTEARMIRHVYEQRWSAFSHAARIRILILPPSMHVLGFIPISVLAGLFLLIGEHSLSVTPMLF
jgi:HCO3- transporter family